MNARRTRVPLLALLGLGGIVLAWSIAALARETPRHEPTGQARGAELTARSLAEPLERDAPSDVTSTLRTTLAPPEVEPLAPASLPFRREDLYGTVLDRDTRAPVEGASVLVFPRDTPVEPGACPQAVLTTDAAGYFRLADVGALQELSVLVQADGYLRARLQLGTGRAGKLMLRRALTISGHVLYAHDRRPAPGVEVSISREGRWDGSALVRDCARTDEGGRFVLANVPPSQQSWIRVLEDGRFPDSHLLDVGEQPVEGLELLIGPSSILRLRLVELGSGVPLAGLRAHLREVGSFETDGAGVVALRVDARRLLALNDAQAFDLEIESEQTCRTRVLIALDALEELHDVPLTRGATLAGRVSDGAGVPVSAAAVSFADNHELLASPRDAWPGLPPGITIHAPFPRSVTSDEQGAFSLDRLFASDAPDGSDPSATLRVSRTGRPPLSIPIDVPPPGGTRWVELVLENGAAVRGRVLLAGEPFAGARVVASCEGQWPWVRCTANDGGEYLLAGLAPGRTLLQVEQRSTAGDSVSVGHASLAEEWLTLVRGETLEHDLHVTDARVAIEGIVRDENGVPLSGILVYVRGTGMVLSHSGVIRGMSGQSTTSNVDGTFRLLVADDPIPLEIVAWRAGTESSTNASAGARDVELVMPASGTLLLAAVDETGNAVPSLSRALWWPTGTSLGSPSTGVAYMIAPRADQRFVLEIPVGRWDVEVLAPGYAPATLVGANVPADAPGAETLTLRRGTTLELLHAPEGPAPSEVLLRLMTEAEMQRIEGGDETTDFLSSIRELRPSGDGTLLVPSLAPGGYVLRSLAPGWSLEPRHFLLPDVEHHRVELRWTPEDRAR